MAGHQFKSGILEISHIKPCANTVQVIGFKPMIIAKYSAGDRIGFKPMIIANTVQVIGFEPMNDLQAMCPTRRYYAPHLLHSKYGGKV